MVAIPKKIDFDKCYSKQIKGQNFFFSFESHTEPCKQPSEDECIVQMSQSFLSFKPHFYF